MTTDSLVTLSAMVPGFASEYPAYFFRTQQTWDGVSLVAVRRGGASEPGLYAVVTADSDEMREALAQEG